MSAPHNTIVAYARLPPPRRGEEDRGSIQRAAGRCALDLDPQHGDVNNQRLMDYCTIQLQARGLSRTRNESKEEEAEADVAVKWLQ